MIDDVYQQITRNEMFTIDTSDGEKKLPFTILNTSDINKIYGSCTNKKNKEKVIVFNSIYIRPNINFYLTDIGYSPSEKLEIKNFEGKYVYFYLPSFNYTFSYYFLLDSTIFDVRFFFAHQFLTIAQNIYIQYQGQLLQDNQYIFDFENSKDSPFFILTKEDYQLYYVFMNCFFFVCMRGDSTINDLRDSISSSYIIYSGLVFGENIKKNFRTDNQIAIENSEQTLNYLSKEIQLFDFNYVDNKEKFIDIKIKLYVEKDKKPVLITITNISPNSTIYLITCILEKKYQIDRSLFIPYEKYNTHIGENTSILGQKILIFELKKTLRVKVLNQIHELSYFTTIENIKQIINSKDKSFGIIINKHFVITDNSKPFLTYYLNNSNDPNEASEIIIKDAIAPCHVLSFTNKKEKKIKHFIVPDCLSIERIFNLYLQLNIDVVSFKKKRINKKTNCIDYEYQLKDKRYIDIIFIDESNKSNQMTVDVKGQDPRVIDLLQAVSDKLYSFFNKIFRIFSSSNSESREAFEAYLDQEKLPFLLHLSSINYSRSNKIIVKKYSTKENNQMTLKVHNLIDHSTIDLNYENLLTSEIIKRISNHKSMNNNSVKLFLEYNELEPNDRPLICMQEQNILIFNEIKEKKNLIISNGSDIKVTLSVKSANYSLVSDLIIGLFTINDFGSLQFYLKNGQSEYNLPRYFNAGSLPDNSEILIKYIYNKSDYITLSHKGKIKKIKLLNTDVQIKVLKQEIQRELGMYDKCCTSIYFSFYDCKLDEEKKLSDYKIPEDAIISVLESKDLFSITVKLPEKIKTEYKISPSENARDIKNLIKEQYGYYNEDDFDLINEKGVKMLEEIQLKPEMIITLKCKKKKIQSNGSLGKKYYTISEILTVKEATTFLSTKLKNKNISLFIFNESEKFFEKVEPTKRLFEIEEKLFVHQLFRFYSFLFKNQNLFLDKNDLSISECNKLGWYKENFISKIIHSNPKLFYFEYDNSKLKESKTLYETVGTKPISIKFSSKEESDNYKNKNDDDISNNKSYHWSCSSLNKTSASEDEDLENSDSDSKDFIYEEEEEESPDKEKLFPYNFQINGEQIITIELKETATIQDAKEKIANLKGGLDPNLISIVLHKITLKKSIEIKTLKMSNDDYFFVFIRNPDDILLSTAKALRMYGQADVEEYYSEYEYEEEDEEKDEKKDDDIFSNTGHYKFHFFSVTLFDKLQKEKIGRGATSEVFKVSLSEYPDKFLAMKVIDIDFIKKDDNNDDDDVEIDFDTKTMSRFYQEFEVLSHIDHPYIIKTRGLCIGDKTHPPSILLEYCPFSLKKIIKKLNKDEIKRIIIEICEAMMKIHELNIIHRDLKPENILIDADKHAKVSDFGLCTLIKLDAETISRTQFAGTLAFMAPELLNNKKNYDEKVDVYSFGVLLFWILTKGKYPSVTVVEVAKGIQSEIPSSITNFSTEIIKRCWSFNPEDRPSFKEICEIIKENKKHLIG